MTYYQKYSDDDLIEAYNSMMEYSGNATEELLTEIQVRGGMDAFMMKIKHNQLRSKEIEKLSNEVYSLCRKALPLGIIKTKLRSAILPEPELLELIESSYNSYHANIRDKSITGNTIIRCLISAAIAILAGSIIWGYSLYYSHGVNYIVLSFLSVFIFLTVQLMVGKSTNNILVFLTAFFSIVISFLGGYYVESILPL